MKFFPLYLNISEAEILILGGGRHALERVNRLLPYGAKITVIAKSPSEELQKKEGIALLKRGWRKSDIKRKYAFIVAALEADECQKIHTLSKRKGVPLNSVDIPSCCDFYFPAILSSEHLSVAISTEGLSPSMGLILKDKIAPLLPKQADEILLWLYDLRPKLKEALPRNEFKKALKSIAKEALEKQAPLLQIEIDEIINSL